MTPEVRTYSIQISSERGSIAAIEPFVISIPEAHRLTAERFHDLLLALTEAVNNAIIHGNECDSSKRVHVDIQVFETEFLVLIRDFGKGFDPEALPDPRHPDNLMREGGRGVFLIRHLADVVEIYRSDPGTTVLLKYFIT
ncbi:MAG: ATP-binding protein [bacterium]|nr:ATP-binding protein [bacterium]